MFLYAALDAEWVKATQGHSIGLMLAAFVAPLELVATVFAFLARDTVAGATLGLFAGSWFVGGLLTLQGQARRARSGARLLPDRVHGRRPDARGGRDARKAVRSPCCSPSRRRAACWPPLYELGAGKTWNQVGGWLALAIFCIAMYGGLAFLLEDALGRTVLPLGRRGGSEEAIEGGLSEQLRGLEDEAGVRHTL